MQNIHPFLLSDSIWSDIESEVGSENADMVKKMLD
jgi:hypothetical protein